jgi:hypothetical protein
MVDAVHGSNHGRRSSRFTRRLCIHLISLPCRIEYVHKRWTKQVECAHYVLLPRRRLSEPGEVYDTLPRRKQNSGDCAQVFHKTP